MPTRKDVPSGTLDLLLLRNSIIERGSIHGRGVLEGA